MWDITFRPVDKSKYTSVKSTLSNHPNCNKNNADAKHYCGVLQDTSAGPNTELNLSSDGTKTAAERDREVKSVNLFVFPSNCIPLHR